MRQSKPDDIWAALCVSRRAFLVTGAFSLAVNLLALVGPLYMMQVYDRVMSSRSVPTLIVLSMFVLVLFALSGFLDLVRSRIMTRISLAFDAMAADRVFDASSRLGLMKGRIAGHYMRDFDTMRQFLSSPAPGILFDVPWVPIFLAILFMFHWSLGAVALASALILFAIAIVTERRTHHAVGEATQASRKANDLANAGHENAEVLAAMGMLDNFRHRWLVANRASLLLQTSSGDSVASLTAISKTLRMIVQSGILGLGAYLAIHGHVSAGAIIAGSILLGRALSPVEQAIAQWRNVVRARQAYRSLTELMQILPPPSERIELPVPKGHLEVRGLRLVPPGSQRLALANANFAVGPGQVLAVAGQSASGKSTLSRALVGVWPIAGGEIRLDGARLDQWDQQRLGRHIGYMPQDVELFAGTVRDNICRFDPDADDAAIIAAAELARAHKMILDLPQGYDTELGSFGCHLSGGQKQRLALARALYGDPQLLVLDEPNSNLDSDGEGALVEAIGELKARGRTVIIVSHRSSAIARADLLLVLENGQQRLFGPREEVIRAMNSSAVQPARPQAAEAKPAQAQPASAAMSQPAVQPATHPAPQRQSATQPAGPQPPVPRTQQRPMATAAQHQNAAPQPAQAQLAQAQPAPRQQPPSSQAISRSADAQPAPARRQPARPAPSDGQRASLQAALPSAAAPASVIQPPSAAPVAVAPHTAVQPGTERPAPRAGTRLTERVGTPPRRVAPETAAPIAATASEHRQDKDDSIGRLRARIASLRRSADAPGGLMADDHATARKAAGMRAH